MWRRAGSLFVFLLPLSARAADQPAPDLPRYAAARLDGGRFLADRVVHGAALSPDGRRLVVRTVDRCFVLDAATGRRVAAAPDRRAGKPAWAAFAGPDRLLVDAAGAYRLWSATTGEPDGDPVVWRDRTGTTPGPTAAVSADGARLAFPRLGPDDAHTAVVRDLASGRDLAELPLPHRWPARLALSADGSRVAAAGAEPARDAGADDPPPGQLVVVWDVATRAERCRVRVPTPAAAAHLSPDGRRLVTAGRDQPARVWDAATGAAVCRLDGAAGEGWAFAFSPDAKSVAGADRGGVVRVWDPATGRAAGECRPPAEARPLPGASPFAVHDLRFRPDGRLVAVGSAGRHVLVWDARTGAPFGPSAAPVAGLGFAADGAVLIAGGDLSVARWAFRPAGPGEVARLPVAGLYPVADGRAEHRAAAFSGDGRWLAATVTEDTAAVADLAAGARVADIDLDRDGVGRFPRLALTRDGSVLAASGYYRPRDPVRLRVAGDALPPRPALWDIATGLRPVGVRAAAGEQTHLAVTPDGGRVAVAAVGEGAVEVTVWDRAAGKPAGPAVRVPVAGTGLVGYVALSPDGRAAYLATSTGYARRVDAAAGRVVAGGDDPPFAEFTAAPAVSPDGRLLAVPGMPRGGGRPATWVLEAATLEVRVALDPGPSHGRVAFSPDGRWLATGGHDGSVTAWDVGAMYRPDGPARSDPADLWARLSGWAGGPGWAAVRELAARPDVAVPLLRAKVPPALAATDAEVAALVGRLDAPDFAAREAATRDLGRLGPRAVPALRAAAGRSPSPEAARRIGGLLRRADGPDPDGPAQARAVEVAERAGTAAARDLLTAWAGGAADAPLTREARRALDRLRAKSP